MSKKHCNCGGCDCCNGYVRDAKNPNRYVDLETGKERDIEKRKWKSDWLIWWLLIAVVLTHFGNTSTITKSNKTQQNSKDLVN
jgi:hypothetical protein